MATEHTVVLYWHHSLNRYFSSCILQISTLQADATNGNITFIVLNYKWSTEVQTSFFSSVLLSQLSPYYKALRKRPFYTTLITLGMIIQSKAYNRGPRTH